MRYAYRHHSPPTSLRFTSVAIAAPVMAAGAVAAVAVILFALLLMIVTLASTLIPTRFTSIALAGGLTISAAAVVIGFLY